MTAATSVEQAATGSAQRPPAVRLLGTAVARTPALSRRARPGSLHSHRHLSGRARGGPTSRAHPLFPRPAQGSAAGRISLLPSSILQLPPPPGLRHHPGLSTCTQLLPPNWKVPPFNSSSHLPTKGEAAFHHSRQVPGVLQRHPGGNPPGPP